MPLGPGPSVPGAAPGPIAPTHRPRWLLVLSSIALMYGGMLLISGLGDLRNPTAAAKLPMTRPLAPDEEALTRELIAVNAAIVARHASAIRARAAASTVLALILLYSAAAALSRDRHGRRATLAAAWLAIAYQVGGLPMVLPIAEDYAATSAPILARMIASDVPVVVPAADAGAAAARDGDSSAMAPPTAAGAPPERSDRGAATAPASGGEPPPRPEAVAGFMHTVFILVPIVTAILGILGSLLMITYFGGWRGRALYGLPPKRPPPRR